MSFNYDYYEAVTLDLKYFIIEHFDITSVDEVQALEYDDIYDAAFVSDMVTGNASGSYTFNRAQAREYVMDNTDLLDDVVSEGVIDYDTIGQQVCASDFESLDVCIRCHVMGACIEDAIQGIIDDIEGVQA